MRLVRLVRGFSCALVAVCAATASTAQEAEADRMIVGTVSDMSGAALPGAFVEAVSWPASDPRRRGAATSDGDDSEPPSVLASTAADDDGVFRLVAPDVPRLGLRVSADGFAALRVRVLPDVTSERKPLMVVLQDGVLVTGAVLTPDGAPIEGARVLVDLDRQRPRALRPGSEQEGALRDGKAEATTREDGAFELGVLPRADGYVLEVGADGHVPWSTRLALREGRSDRNVAISLPAAGTIRGVVLDDDDLPVPGVVVTATDLMRAGVREDELPRTETGEDGAFLLGALAEGIYRVELKPPAARNQIHDRIEVFPGETTDLGRLRPESGTSISGRLVDRDDEPISGIRVAALREIQHTRRRERTTTSGDDGRFTLRGLTAGAHEIRAEPEETYLEATEELDAPASGVRLELERGAIVRGTVRASDGSPLQNVVVKALREDDRGRLRHAKTGEIEYEDGVTYEIEPLPGATIVVAASARHHALSSTEPFEITAGNVVEDVDLVLRRGASIAGRVVRRDTNEPLAGAIVGATARWSDAVVSDRDGRFLVNGLAPGPVTLLVTHAEFAPAELSLVVGEEPPDAIVIELSRGATIEGAVTRLGQLPVQGVTLLAMRPAGGELDSTATDADGFYRFARMPAGTVMLVRRGGGGRFEDEETRAVHVADGETKRVDFELGGLVHGLVTLDGLPQPGIRIALGRVVAPADESVRLHTYEAQSGWTDPEGRYRLDNVRPGTKTLNVEFGGQTSVRKIDIPAVPEHEHDVALPSRVLTGVVVDADTGGGLPAGISARLKDSRQPGGMSMAFGDTDETGESRHIAIGGSERDQVDTLPDGSFRIRLESSAAYGLSAWSSGYGSAIEEIAAGAPLAPLRLELSRSATISGELVGPGGSLVENARVCMQQEGGTSCSWGASQRFRFEGRHGKPATLVGVAPGLAVQSEELDALPADGDGGPTRQDLVFGPGGKLRVHLPAEAGDDASLAAVVNEDGTDLLLHLTLLDQIERADDERGPVLAVGGLAPGPYEIQISLGEGEENQETRSVDIRAGETAVIDLASR